MNIPVILESTKIDPHATRFETMPRSLHGNILKGHGRDHTVPIFLEFTAAGPDLRAKLGALAAKVVTSALARRDQTDRFKADGTSGGIFGNVPLTSMGY